MPNPFEDTTITIKRIDTSVAVNEVGELVDTSSSYTTAARGNLPTSANARVTLMDAEERIAFGVQTTQLVWIIRTKTNIQCDTRDRIVFTDADGVQHDVRVVIETHRTSSASPICRTIAVEDKAAT